ncbi:MAG: flavin-dependent oxidoreductase [Betaproteobacteria bacterium]|nr:MAG: flavin-dependent oxidoreductase [Betaproteobacteria bacterium]
MTHHHSIAIAGAGIGGLTAAIALADGGHSVTVFEAVREIKPLGVGINVLPHAVAVLTELGLGGKLSTLGVATDALLFTNRFGQTIYRDARGIAGGYSHPQHSIHRGALHMALLAAAAERGPAIQIHIDSRVDGFSNTADGVALQVKGASERTATADVFIAADGIHSASRAQCYPNEGPPKWNGMMMWRGTTLARAFLGGRTMVQAGNKFAKFVAYPIKPIDPKTGLQLINWICDIRVENGIGGTLTAPIRESWSTAGHSADLLPRFGDWVLDWQDGAVHVRDIINNAAQIFQWPMVDRDPLPCWTHGRMTLLGDAAHPMYPIGSNGATQAILDAKALADALSQHDDVNIALQSYEALRRPMTAEIVQLNRGEGLDIILDMVDERAPNGFAALADVIDPTAIESVVTRYKRAAGHRTVPSAV